jgi:hypothetical protein
VSAANLAFCLGPPALAAALLGLLSALRGGPARALAPLLVPGVSYQLGFLALVLYCYDRFMLPWAVLLAFFGGHALDALLARGGAARVLGGAWLLLIVLYGVGRAVALDLHMRHDGRYAVEDWLAARAEPQETIGQLAPSLFLPRLKPAGLRAVGPDPAQVLEARPRFLVDNAAYARRAHLAPEEHALRADLASGAAGYRLALVHRWRAPAWLPFDPADLDRPTLVVSNLARVNPEIHVWERVR